MRTHVGCSLNKTSTLHRLFALCGGQIGNHERDVYFVQSFPSKTYCGVQFWRNLTSSGVSNHFSEERRIRDDADL